jgi:drug/metabolite transporter (DMT)-like permease
MPGFQRSRLVAPAILLVAGGLLGVSATLAKLASGAGLGPLPFLAWSCAGAAAVLTAIAAARGRLPPLGRRTAEYFLVAALVGVALPNLLFAAAVPHVGAGFVSLAVAFPPLMTYLGALALRMERFSPVRAAGVALALAGAGLIAALKTGAPGGPVLWVAATLAGPVLLAVGNLYRTLRWPPGVAADALAPGMMAAAAGMLLLAGLAPGASLAVPAGDAAPALIAAQAAVFSVQYLLYFELQRRGGPVYLSLMGSVGAVVGVPLAVLLLGEAAPAGLGAGALMIAGGIAAVTLGAARAAPART